MRLKPAKRKPQPTLTPAEQHTFDAAKAILQHIAETISIPVYEDLDLPDGTTYYAYYDKEVLYDWDNGDTYEFVVLKLRRLSQEPLNGNINYGKIKITYKTHKTSPPTPNWLATISLHPATNTDPTYDLNDPNSIQNIIQATKQATTQLDGTINTWGTQRP